MNFTDSLKGGPATPSQNILAEIEQGLKAFELYMKSHDLLKKAKKEAGDFENNVVLHAKLLLEKTRRKYLQWLATESTTARTFSEKLMSLKCCSPSQRLEVFPSPIIFIL